MSNGKGSGRRPAAITRAEFDAAWERNFGKVVAVAKNLRCAKCGETSGNSWSQCRGSCPMPMSPHFTGAKPEHVCGLMGFNGMIGDVCPACSSRADAEKPITYHCDNCNRTFSDAEPRKMCRCTTTYWRVVDDGAGRT